jgi:hypothetical protein
MDRFYRSHGPIRDGGPWVHGGPTAMSGQRLARVGVSRRCRAQLLTSTASKQRGEGDSPHRGCGWAV